MAFTWANVLVPPTGSSGLDTGSHLDVDEAPPWSDADECLESISGSTSETAIFSGFDLSLAGGEKKGFHIWARMRTNSPTFSITVTVKQDTTTLWTSSAFNVTNTSFRTFVIPVPDASFVGSDIDNLSLEFACENLGANSSFHWSWLRISKSPFTTAQEAALPSSLTGQDFVCYRAADIGVLGGADGESVLLIPDSSGKGRHSVLRVGSATYETDAPEGVAVTSGRYVGALGVDSATGEILWSGNKVMHSQVYPQSVAGDQGIFSVANVPDFVGVVIPDRKHILAIQTAEWLLMHGDGSAEVHLPGNAVVVNESIRITQWVQISGGNEHMWENDDPTPTVDGSSGDNPFNTWSLFNRETDNRPFIGRLQEIWFIEGTGITEVELDIARSEWVTGIGGGGPDPGSNDDESENRMGGTGAIRRGNR